METILLVITIAAVATAVAAVVAARRVQRREQDRSEARVAALSAAANAHEDPASWPEVVREARWTTESDPPRPEPQLRPETAAQVDNASGGIFGSVQRVEPTPNRVPMLAAAALLVLLGGAVAFFNSSPADQRATGVAQAGHSEPLELVSLGHSREPSLLTISGIVRNPSTGGKLEGLTAVVSLLDRTGTLVSTKDVPLDYRALGPGEEAPFKVSIPDSASIARYRVSFRAGSDVVPHVDRRSDAKLASSNR